MPGRVDCSWGGPANTAKSSDPHCCFLKTLSLGQKQVVLHQVLVKFTSAEDGHHCLTYHVDFEATQALKSTPIQQGRIETMSMDDLELVIRPPCDGTLPELVLPQPDDCAESLFALPPDVDPPPAVAAKAKGKAKAKKGSKPKPKAKSKQTVTKRQTKDQPAGAKKKRETTEAGRELQKLLMESPGMLLA